MGSIRSVNGLIRMSKAAGGYFFSRPTMRFFDSIVEPELYPTYRSNPQQGYFITSERFDEETPREWTIRHYVIDGQSVSIETADNTDRFSSKEEAVTYLNGTLLAR